VGGEGCRELKIPETEEWEHRATWFMPSSVHSTDIKGYPGYHKDCSHTRLLPLKEPPTFSHMHIKNVDPDPESCPTVREPAQPHGPPEPSKAWDRSWRWPLRNNTDLGKGV